MATFGGSKAQFFRLLANGETFVLGVAEFQHAICAEFGGVFANFTATFPPLLKVFRGVGRFFKKAPHFFSTNYLPDKSKFEQKNMYPPEFSGGFYLCELNDCEVGGNGVRTACVGG
jgi:hypothetical protein